MQYSTGSRTPLISNPLPSAGAHPQRRVQLRMVQVEDVQHHGLQRIRGDEAMVRPQQPALVVTPCLHLLAQGVHA